MMTCVLVFHSTNLNGPVPTGARLKSGPILATAVGDTMPMQYMASVRRIGPYGSLVTTSTVRLSTTSAPLSEPAMLAQAPGGLPRFWASAEGTRVAARPSTSSPISSRERNARMRLSPVFEQIVGDGQGRVQRVHDAITLADERHPRELERVAAGIERG